MSPQKRPAEVAYIQSLPIESRSSDLIVEPRRDGKLHFHPGVLFYDPMMHYGLMLTCPIHKETLQDSKLWTDGSDSSRNPRLVFGFSCNYILVAKRYTCKLCSSDYPAHLESIMEQVPSSVEPLFLCFKKAAVTTGLFHHIINSCARGSTIKGLTQELQDNRIARFQKPSNDSSSAGLKKSLDTRAFMCPGKDLIKGIFVNFMRINKKYLYQEMRSTRAKSISFDHTFNIADVVQLSGDHGMNVKQFQACFFVLSEEGKIVDFQLTKTLGLSENEEMFRRISLDNKIEAIYTDRCCMDSSFLQSVFGNVPIRLDIFHATNRIVRSLDKKSMSSKNYNMMLRDIRLFPRKKLDSGKQRTMETADPSSISQNLKSLMTSWKKENISEKTKKELEKLNAHAQRGCLSGIPVGCGTQRNESLHQKLKCHFKSRSTMTLELFEGYLLSYVILHNRRKDGDLRPVSFNSNSLAGLGRGSISEDFDENLNKLGAEDGRAIAPSSLSTEVLEVIAENVRKLLKISAAGFVADEWFKLDELLLFGELCNSETLLDELDSLFSKFSLNEDSEHSLLSVPRLLLREMKDAISDENLIKIFGTKDESEILLAFAPVKFAKSEDKLKLCSDISKSVILEISKDKVIKVSVPKYIECDKMFAFSSNGNKFNLIRFSDVSNVNDVNDDITGIKCHCGRAGRTAKKPCSHDRCKCFKSKQACLIACGCSCCGNPFGMKFASKPKVKSCNCGQKKSSSGEHCSTDRCSCHKTKSSCLENPKCSCTNCGNSFGKNEEQENQPLRRNLPNHEGKLGTKPNVEYYEDQNISTREAWSKIETFTLTQLIYFGSHRTQEVEANFDLMRRHFPDLCLNQKSEKQIRCKLKFMSEQCNKFANIRNLKK